MTQIDLLVSAIYRAIFSPIRISLLLFCLLLVIWFMNHKPEQKPDMSVLGSDLDVVLWKDFHCLFLHFDSISCNVLYSLNLQRVSVVGYFCTAFPKYCSCVVRFIMLYYLDLNKGNIFDSVIHACKICEPHTAFEFTWVIRPKTVTVTLSFMLPLVPFFFFFFRLRSLRSSKAIAFLKTSLVFSILTLLLSWFGVMTWLSVQQGSLAAFLC